MMSEQRANSAIWNYKLYGLPFPYFLLITVVVLAATFLGCCRRAWRAALR